MVKRVGRCRVTFINNYEFFYYFIFCLTYINYISACQNMCNVHYVMHTYCSFGKCPAPLLAPIPFIVMRRIRMIGKKTDPIFEGGPIRL